MGQEINTTHFDAGDFAAFYERLREETQLLGQAWTQGVLDDTPILQTGAELELWLTDAAMRPAARNDAVLRRLRHPDFGAELARYNIEINTTPRALDAETFDAFSDELRALLRLAGEQAGAEGCHLLSIGILPTLRQDDLQLDAMSPLNRYRALNEQILRERGKPLHLTITGHTPLHFEHPNVMLESAATSLQIHLQVPARTAHYYYNAALLVSAPLVAVSANSPFLFEHALWEETRIPLFEQAVEVGGYQGAVAGPLRRVSFGTGYCRHSLLECFEENLAHFPVLLPICANQPPECFSHLRLHNGVIWRWNRPLVGLDSAMRPHFRIEHRTLAAPPSIADAVANLAFYLGLVQQLQDQWQNDGELLPFAVAKDNFYQAARHGIDGPIHWLRDSKPRLSKLILDELLSRATVGLAQLGIPRAVRDTHLAVIRERVRRRQTGSHWQRAFIARHGADFRALTEAYHAQQLSQQPVHQWSLN